MRNGKITAIDLFCGAGGFSLAATQLDIHVLAAVDSSRDACETYYSNFVRHRRKASRPRIYCQDIRGLAPEIAMAGTSLEVGELDVLMGGPPCQGYSRHRINGKGVGDARNALLLHYFEFVGAFRPRAFLVENVPGLLWPRHARYLERFTQATLDAGYNLHGPLVLNARDFGVPQSRKRVFMVGIRGDLTDTFAWPEPTHGCPDARGRAQAGKRQWRPARVAFTRPAKPDDPNDVHMQPSEGMRVVFASTPKNGGSRSDSCRVLDCHRNHDGHHDVYGRIDPDRPAPTMTTACINPSKGRFVHPTEDHGITVRQAARLQGFPDSFVFAGGLMASGMQVGNAVPVGLGRAVLKSIAEALEERGPSGAGDQPPSRADTRRAESC